MKRRLKRGSKRGATVLLFEYNSEIPAASGKIYSMLGTHVLTNILGHTVFNNELFRQGAELGLNVGLRKNRYAKL